MKNNQSIYRTRFSIRLTHATIIICFFFVAISGLGLFFPSLIPFSYIFGSPQLSRALHPFFGCIIFTALMYIFSKLINDNLFNKNDDNWFKSIKKIALNNDPELEKKLKIGKYNAGQKVIFWLTMLLISLLFLTGLIIWRKYFSGFFPVWFVRSALLIHSICGIGLILLILGHIYMAFYVKGTISSMISGYVSQKWAQKNHPEWVKQIENKEGKEEIPL